MLGSFISRILRPGSRLSSLIIGLVRPTGKEFPYVNRFKPTLLPPSFGRRKLGYGYYVIPFLLTGASAFCPSRSIYKFSSFPFTPLLNENKKLLNNNNQRTIKAEKPEDKDYYLVALGLAKRNVYIV